MNASSEKRLEQIHPELARRIRLLDTKLQTLGIFIEVVQGLRTFGEQDRLYAQGRTGPGHIVTNVRGGFSNHNFGLAVDVVPFVNLKPNWNATNTIWMTIGVQGEQLGLSWGGHWTKLIDKPHLELPGLDVHDCRVCFNAGGLPFVWQEATKRLV